MALDAGVQVAVEVVTDSPHGIELETAGGVHAPSIASAAQGATAYRFLPSFFATYSA